MVQVAIEDNLEVDVDKSYESEAKKDYLNQSEATFTMELQEDLRSPKSQFYVPLLVRRLEMG